ncbi:MAG: hypothetical protein WCJ69_18150, partial [Betaproteobacteria bacterium]
PEWRRRAAARPGGEQDYLFSPHARDLALPEGEGGGDLARALLAERWLCGEPVIVRGCAVGGGGRFGGERGRRRPRSVFAARGTRCADAAGAPRSRGAPSTRPRARKPCGGGS